MEDAGLLLRDRLVLIVSKQLEINKDKVLESKNFIDDLGADSIDMVSIISDIEKEFAVEIDESYVCLMTSIDDIFIVLNLIKGGKMSELVKLLDDFKSKKSQETF